MNKMLGTYVVPSEIAVAATIARDPKVKSRAWLQLHHRKLFLFHV
jgi:hypothetical protein